jgi:hypothetical protein
MIATYECLESNNVAWEQTLSTERDRVQANASSRTPPDASTIALLPPTYWKTFCGDQARAHSFKGCTIDDFTPRRQEAQRWNGQNGASTNMLTETGDRAGIYHRPESVVRMNRCCIFFWGAGSTCIATNNSEPITRRVDSGL